MRHNSDLDRQARLRLAQARRPLLHVAVGGVARRVAEEPNAWAELWDSPEMRELREAMNER